MQEYKSTKQFKMITEFQCIADKCPDHCCGGWRVSINDATRQLYSEKAPELMEYVVEDSKGFKVENSFTTGNCSQLMEDGLCNIHKNYGEGFLPDTCTFYPRTMRSIGDTLVVSASTSCPEMARLAMTIDKPFDFVEKKLKQIPEKVVDFDIDGTNAEEMLSVVKRFIDETERKDIDSHDIMMRIVLVSKMLDDYQQSSWHKVVEQLFATAEHFQPRPTARDVGKFELVQFLSDLKTNRPERWLRFLGALEGVFRVRVNHDNQEPEIIFDKELLQKYHDNEKTQKKIDRAIKRYIAAELVRILFPYAGTNGDTNFEKIMVVVVQTTILRMALIAHINADGSPPVHDEVVRIVQTLSRGLNHLSRDVAEYYKEKGLLDLGVLHQVIYMY